MMTALLAALTAWAVAALFQRAIDMSPAMLAAPAIGVTVGVTTLAHAMGAPALWSPIIVGVSAYALALVIDLAAYALEERGVLQRVLPTPTHDLEEVVVNTRGGAHAHLGDDALERLHPAAWAAAAALGDLRNALREEGVSEDALRLAAQVVVERYDADASSASRREESDALMAQITQQIELQNELMAQQAEITSQHAEITSQHAEIMALTSGAGQPPLVLEIERGVKPEMEVTESSAAALAAHAEKNGISLAVAMLGMNAARKEDEEG